MIFRGLTSFGPDGQLRGEIAESWSAEASTGLGVPAARCDVPQRRAGHGRGREVDASSRSPARNRPPICEPRSRASQQIEIPDQRTVRSRDEGAASRRADVVRQLQHADHCSRRHRERKYAGRRRSLHAQGARSAASRSNLEAFDRITSSPACPSSSRSASSPMRTRTCASRRCRPATSTSSNTCPGSPWRRSRRIAKLKLDAVDGPFMGLIFNAHRRRSPTRGCGRRSAHAIRRDEIVKAAFFGRGAGLEGICLSPKARRSSMPS